MAVFGTPDFGATAFVILIWLIVWVLILVSALVGAVYAAALLHRENAKGRRYGLVLLLVSGLVPLTCWLGPPHAVRVFYGNYPVGADARDKIKEGMTKEEVTAILGEPARALPEG
jgi:hypothetical protein